MRSLPLILAFALLACGGEELPADTTSGGGGGGTGGGGGGTIIDGGMVQTSDGTAEGFTGQLCLINDLRDPTTCATDTDLTVDVATLDGPETTADASGVFSLPRPDGDTTFYLKVAFNSADFHNAMVPIDIGQSLPRVPIVTEAAWQALVTNVGLVETDGTGSIVAYLSDTGAPLVGAEVIQPTGGAVPVYDGPIDANDWNSGATTGAFGAAIMTNVSSASAEVAYSVSAGAGLEIVNGVPLVDNALTFSFFELP